MNSRIGNHGRLHSCIGGKNGLPDHGDIRFLKVHAYIEGKESQMNEIDQKQMLYIEERIFTIRGLQVMLDSDLAELYGVETKMINRAVKRNPDRFPEDFYFCLTNEESKVVSRKGAGFQSGLLRYQYGTLKADERGRHRKYASKVFTEHGVAMLASVLRSAAAVEMSVQIIKAFVAMRKFLVRHEQLFDKLARIDYKISQADHKFQQIFNALESRSKLPDTGIFFEGQVFDAWVFVSDLVRTAMKSIVLIDNYVDDTVLKLFLKRNEGVNVTIFTRNITPVLTLEAEKFNRQYGGLRIRQLTASHDRFMIIDEKGLYHIGASLKDLGKRWFAFSKIDTLAPAVLHRLQD
jgi:phage regulator Rha-like protein